MAGDYDISAAFTAIEDELIASMIRNMKRHKQEEIGEDRHWSMWQVEQLKSLGQYRSQNQKKYGSEFAELNSKIEALIRAARDEGEMDQEIAILAAIKKGFSAKQISKGAAAEFFRLNERKLEALIKATIDDMEKAETAVLRMANDQYRKAIFNAQVYANTGAGTYEKAVDMATKDMLSAGLNCVEYKNGARHTLADYADMAIRTASKRAYLQGEGSKRQEWGIHTVIMNKRGNPCPKCLPFVGKVLIDDVWSGGSQRDGKYPLMSYAVECGLYHPRCKDSHTTYFPGISTSDDTWSEEELGKVGLANKREARQQYASRRADKYGRLAAYSLDQENQEKYKRKADEWKNVEKEAETDIINLSDTKEGTDVHSVGKIDKDIYKCITDDIVTDEVIITDERIAHILERHPDDYERFYSYIPEILKKPDYIIAANRDNTGVLLKEIERNGEKFKLILRIAVKNDPAGYKNSIISFWHIGDTTWRKTLKNKNILYRGE